MGKIPKYKLKQTKLGKYTICAQLDLGEEDGHLLIPAPLRLLYKRRAPVAEDSMMWAYTTFRRLYP